MFPVKGVRVALLPTTTVLKGLKMLTSPPPVLAIVCEKLPARSSAVGTRANSFRSRVSKSLENHVEKNVLFFPL